MDIVGAIIALGEQLSREQNAAYDLWSWLPSHQVTKRNHEDYVDTFTPSVHDVMLEASIYIYTLVKKDYKPTLDEQVMFNRCGCGEEHLAPASKSD